MNINMYLVKEILINIKKFGAESVKGINGYTNEEFHYHVHLMKQAGLVEASDVTDHLPKEFILHDITWEGHEFLANSQIK